MKRDDICPGRTPYIVPRKDTPHRPLVGPQHIPRKDTLHRASKGHPSSATEKKPCIAPPGMHSFIEDGINLNTNLLCESWIRIWYVNLGNASDM